MNQSNKKIRFQTLSEQAATAERQGNYAVAADLWDKAANLAPNDSNFDWCSARHVFCQRCVVRPFAKE